MKSFYLKNLMLAAAASVAVLGGGARSAQATDAIPVLLCPFGCGPMAGDTILMNQLIQSGSGVMLLPRNISVSPPSDTQATPPSTTRTSFSGSW